MTKQAVSETGQHTPERDEWCHCKCHTGAGCPTQLTLIYDRIGPLAAERDTLLEEKASLLAVLGKIQLRVEPGRSGAWTLDDAVSEVAWIDAECRLAIVKGGALDTNPHT